MNEASSFTPARLTRWACQGAVFGIAVLVGIVVFTVGPETVAALRDLPWAVGPVAAGLIVLAWSAAATRVWLDARAWRTPIRWRAALVVSLSSEFGVSASPTGMGGAAVRLGLSRRLGVPFSAGTAMIGFDAVVDGIFFAVTTVPATWILFTDPDWREVFARVGSISLPTRAVIVGVLGALIAVAGLWAALRSRHVGASLRALSGRGPGRGRFRRLRRRSAAFVARCLRSARDVVRERPAVVAANFGLATVQWLGRYGVLPVLLAAFAHGRNPLPLILLQGAFFALSFASVFPGGGGIVEVLSLFVLPLFVEPHLVGVVLLLWRFFTYYLYLIAGGAAFAWAVRRIGGPEPPDGEPAATDA